MKPATAPRDDELQTRLLYLDPHDGRLLDETIGDLATHLRASDLLVVNDAATLPASFRARLPNGGSIELRLVGEAIGNAENDLETPASAGRSRAVVFGEGDYRTPTERRLTPEPIAVGTRLELSRLLHATVSAVSPISERLLDVEFDLRGAALFHELYALGRVIQYAHVAQPLALWSVQTAYAGRPWAFEMPSAGRPLRWSTLLDLMHTGIIVRGVTHAAGVSATGDPRIDAALPLPERFSIPRATARAISATRAKGGRVIAVGTSP
ncbi:MAG: hypothetical protein NVS3B20_23590 [Polyangiales bacterium]